MEGERPLSSREVFAGRLLRVRVDEVELRGRVATREVVEHPGAVAILAMTPNDDLVMVKQYRHAAGRMTIEIPAGTLGAGEDPAGCAARELKEETGFTAGTLHRVCSFYTAIGFCTEVLHLFVARELQEGDQEYEDDEEIEVLSMPVSSAMDLIGQGEIMDAKTVAAVFWAQLHALGEQRAEALMRSVSGASAAQRQAGG